MKNSKIKDSITASVGLKKEDDDSGEQILHPVSGAENDKKEQKPPLSRKLRSGFGKLFNFKRTNTIEEEVAELIEEHDPEGVHISPEERSILNNVLNLGDSKVQNVMIPRTDIVAVADNFSLDDIRKTLLKQEHTRLPVYKESLDNVVGFIHIKDLIPLFGSDKKFHINDVLRKILYVPPSMKVVDLLVQMRAKRVHMALVLDEYGGTIGIVTMEDLMEEIVGQIEDEHDDEDEDDKERINKISDGIFEVSARISLQELDEKIGSSFKDQNEDDDFDTVGGLVFFMFGHVPEKTEQISHASGYIFKVIDADERSVKKVLISKVN
jgi:CBS domain containing-hemolysin-like protein